MGSRGLKGAQGGSMGLKRGQGVEGESRVLREMKVDHGLSMGVKGEKGCSSG